MMGDKDDYLTPYRVFFENFATTLNPEDQLPVNIGGYTITEAELPGEVIYWTTQYLTGKQCPHTLMIHLQRIILDEVRIASKKHPNEFGYNSDESEFIALRLMQAVTARVNDVCLRYLDNSRLDTLPPPPPQSLKEYKTVSSATKNSRRVMEDRHVEIGNLEALFGIETTEPTSFYAVYDGHAGSAAATYCAAHLHQYLVESPHFTRDLRQATHDAYLRTDAEFIRKSNQKRASGGSTAVSVAVRGRRLVAAWAGDSQALLAKRMRLMQLVNPHKPDRPDEKKRIESSGGTVLYWGTWRVNGQLAVSRAIGDAQYKPYVTARPEIIVVDLDGDEDFVVVACDGLWDVLSEDAVAFSVYKQIINDPDDLKAVPENLVRQAKRDGSEDNISVIVVFLKDPRDIVADNYPPMDLGLDNAVVNVPPFALENEPCKTVAAEIGAADCAGGDNGVSDSDSDDLGPETAVDADLDLDDDTELREEPAPPTPPAHAVESSHVDGNLVDNVAESGEESEDEWNYFKGEGEREQIPSEEADDPPRSDTPGQDNSAWESSSVDMNSSPLNPDAPVFVPGLVAGPDVLLAESPRKPMPMDDIELPDGNQFQSEAVVRPAEIQDMDNCDQRNGHHNISMEGVTEHLNGNDKDEMESLGFGFNVGIDPEKVKDTTLIQDFERIQKDTTDFCNIQVFQTHTETNPFNTDGDDELFERLKNKERDPMSMSFYQEKDDDTCERFGKIEPSVDLNAVQPLPDSDDEDMQPNGIYQSEDKENVCPREKSNFFNLEEDSQEPNNDILRFDDISADTLANNITNLDNFMAFNSTSNKQNYSNTEFECNVQPEPVVQTDTPESHKLLFEQIPEIPDGKSSELGFTNEDLLDPSESDKDVRAITPQDETSQDIEMESKLEESPSAEVQPEISGEIKDDLVQSEHLDVSETRDQVEQLDNIENEITTESETTPDFEEKPIEQVSDSQEIPHGNIIVDVHKNPDPECNNLDGFEVEEKYDKVHSAIKESSEFDVDPEIRLEAEHELEHLQAPASQLPSDSPIHSPFSSSPAPQEELLQESPVPQDTSLPESAPLSQEVSMHRESPHPQESQLPSGSPLPSESSVPSTIEIVDSVETTTSLIANSPLPTELEGSESIEPEQSQLPSQDDVEHLIPAEIPLPRESPAPSESSLPDNVHMGDSKVLANSPLPIKNTKESSEMDAEMKRRIKLRNRQKVEAQIAFLLDGNDSDLDSDTESSIELQTDTQIESEIQPHTDSEQILQFEPETCVLDDMQQESTFAVDNVESQQHVEEPIHRSPLAVDQNTEESFSREQQDLSGLVQVADEMSEPPQPPSESPLPVEASLQEVVHRHIESPVCEPLRDSPVPAEPLRDSPVPVEQLRDSPVPDEPLRDSPVPAEPLRESPVPAEPLRDSPVPDEPLRDSPVPAEPLRDSPVPAEPLRDSPVPAEPLRDSPVPAEPLRDSPVPVEPLGDPPVPVDLNRPENVSPAPVETILSQHTIADNISRTDQTILAETIAPAETNAPVKEIEVVSSSAPLIESDFKIELPQEPDMKCEQLAEKSAPTPDIVPEERPRNELVTDIDIGIPESKAQEICVPVTSENQHEDVVRPGATPPPTPAIGDAPVAAAVAATAVAATAVTAAAVKSSSPKKSPTTPTAKLDSKATPKSTAARTPVSTKRVSSATTAVRSPAAATARTPAARTSSAKASPAAPRAAAKPISSPAKAAAVPSKPAAISAKPAAPLGAKPMPRAAAAPAPRTTAAPRAAPAPRSAPKAPASKPATAPPKAAAAAAKPTTTTASKPAPRPPPITRPPPKSAPSAPSAPITKPKEVKAKAPGPPLPLTNGDVKPIAKAAPAARAPITRPAPRAAPRPAAPAAAAPARAAAPKPAARAPLDKQSKDLANKRITAKAAPPRTVPNKAPVGIKGTRAVKKLDNKKDSEQTLTNGGSEQTCKAPPSPPADALLPDVIA